MCNKETNNFDCEVFIQHQFTKRKYRDKEILKFSFRIFIETSLHSDKPYKKEECS